VLMEPVNEFTIYLPPKIVERQASQETHPK